MLLLQKPHRMLRSTVRAHRPKRYYALLACFIVLTALAPLVEHFFWAPIILGTTVATSLLLTAWTAEGVGRSRTIALTFAALTCVMWILAFCDHNLAFHSIAFRLTACAITLSFFAITGSIMLMDVYSGTVTNNRICGAICVYILIGFCFAMLNLMLFLTDAGAYKDSSASDKEHTLSANLPTHRAFPIFIYFSFCTLSTVGYGDITPVSRLARTIAWLEAVSGQIYLTVLVARLVGLHIAFTNRAQESEF